MGPINVHGHTNSSMCFKYMKLKVHTKLFSLHVTNEYISNTKLSTSQICMLN